jgi:hypothetical protein
MKSLILERLRPILHSIRHVLLKFLGIDYQTFNQELVEASKRSQILRDEIFYLKSVLYLRLFQLPMNPTSIKIENFPLASKSDINQVLSYLFSKSKLTIKSIPAPIVEQISQASAKSIFCFSGDDDDELNNVSRIFPNAECVIINDQSDIFRNQGLIKNHSMKTESIKTEYWNVNTMAAVQRLSSLKSVDFIWTSGALERLAYIQLVSFLQISFQSLTHGGSIAGYFQKIEPVQNPKTNVDPRKVMALNESILLELFSDLGFESTFFHTINDICFFKTGKKNN